MKFFNLVVSCDIIFILNILQTQIIIWVINHGTLNVKNFHLTQHIFDYKLRPISIDQQQKKQQQEQKQKSFK